MLTASRLAKELPGSVDVDWHWGTAQAWLVNIHKCKTGKAAASCCVMNPAPETNSRLATLLLLLHWLPHDVCRFQFESDALEVVIAGKEEEQTENKFVGGRNRWAIQQCRHLQAQRLLGRTYCPSLQLGAAAAGLWVAAGRPSFLQQCPKQQLPGTWLATVGVD
jgi:hypothetical protein